MLRPSSVCTPDGCGKIQSILLVHKPRKRDSWQLPQGGMEEGESIEQTALRELHEEAGLKFDAVSQVSTCTYCYDFPPEFVERHHPINSGQHLCFVVIEAPEGIKVTVDNNEVDAFAWVLEEELPRYLERKVYLDVILNVLKEYKEKSAKA